MKFLGIRNAHDVNICYSDGQTVKYLKFERFFQQKHYDWYTNDFQLSTNMYGKTIAVSTKDNLPKLIELARHVFPFKTEELDAICMSADTRYHNMGRELEPDELYYEVDKSNQGFWNQFNCPIYNINHHYSHALSIWPVMDYNEIETHFVIDGEGDKNIHTSVIKNNNVIDYIQKKYNSIDGKDNIGLSDCLDEMSKMLGITGASLDWAGKLMALKSYHNVPKQFLTESLERYKHLNYIDMDYFLNEMFRVQPPEIEMRQKIINLAYFVHEFCQIKMPEYMKKFANSDDIISYTGGTCQNTVVNTYIQRTFPKCVMIPHCPDDGIGLGCLEFLRQKYNQPEFDKSNFPFWQLDEAPQSTPSNNTIEKTAEYLAQGKIVAWYQGNGELGPRALGNRSILMDPSIKDGKDTINNKVKHREPYRPFGVSILQEESHNYFDCDFESPYMLHVVDVKSKYFPAITHVDGTSRIQTVNHEPQYTYYRKLIETFKNKTGIPMLLNTSLNNNGRPIAGHLTDAKELYDTTQIDVLVIGDDIMVKS